MEEKAWTTTLGESFIDVFDNLLQAAIRREIYEGETYVVGVRREAKLQRQLTEGKITHLSVKQTEKRIEIEYRLAPSEPA